MPLVPVREEDKQKAYYKYYAAGMPPTPPEDGETVRNCMKKPEDGLPHAQRNLFLERESYPAETGVYPLDRGGYLVAGNIPTPDLTGEMLAWWYAWHPLDPFRYACWDPEDHYDVRLDDAGRARILNPDIPNLEKVWGTVHTVKESLAPGAPLDVMEIHFVNPGDVGFDMGKLGTPGCRYLACGRTGMVTPDGKRMPIFTALTLAQDKDGNNEVRERFWLGYDVVDGESVCILPPGVRIPEMEAVAQALVMHNLREYRNLNRVLPGIYAEEKDNW